MDRLLRGEFTPSQTGAFLQALRIKETNADELVGAAIGVRSFQAPAGLAAESSPIVVNLAFDTPRKGGVLSVLAAAYLRRLDLAHPVVVWEPPSLFPGVRAIETTLASLRADTWLSDGECLMIAVRDMVPNWAELASIRAELGFRTILNTLEKVISPLPNAPVMVGISHGTFSRRLAEVLLRLGSERSSVVQGHHGTCDLGFGEKPAMVAEGSAAGIRETEYVIDGVGRPDPSILLLSSLESWPDLVRRPGSPIWPAIRAQSAFMLSAALDIPAGEAIERIQSAGAPDGR
jgi:anthranilate phosphoribosyltransferase